MAFTFDLTQVESSSLHASRSFLGDVDAASFVLHDEEINSAFNAAPAGTALLQLAQMMRRRVSQKPTTLGAGPFRKAWEDRLRGLDVLIADIRNGDVPPIFGGGGGSPSSIAVTKLSHPDLTKNYL